MAAFDVEYNVSSSYRATIWLRGTNTAHDLSETRRAIITYNDEERRVTVITPETETAHVGDEEGRFVRSLCSHLPAEKSTGFSTTNVGLLASAINTAAEVLAFSGSSLRPPISVDAVFKADSRNQDFIFKITIASSGTNVLAETKLGLYQSNKVASGTLFSFIRKESEEGFPEIILSDRNTGEHFNVPNNLARKVQIMFNKASHPNVLLLSRIPHPLLWLLRYNVAADLEARAELVRDLMFKPSRLLEWMLYYWVQDIAVCGCGILGFENVAASLEM